MLYGDYSSSLTFVYKALLPPVWSGLFGYGTWRLFTDPENLVFNRIRGGAPPGTEWLFITLWLLGSVSLFWIAWRLTWCRATGSSIVLSGLVSETEIPFARIRRVHQVPWLRPPVIRIVFSDSEGNRRTAWFMPAFTWLRGIPADPDLLPKLQAIVPRVDGN